jgi:hypothetical protein
MKPVWRNAGAEDSLRAEGGFSLLVRHIESESGRGFMPVTYFFDQMLESGRLFPGEDPIAYMQAVTRGRRMFERAMKREDIIGAKPVKIKAKAAKSELAEQKPATIASVVELATQAQKDTILRLRKRRGFWQKGKKKLTNDNDTIKVIRQEYFCDWSSLTKEEAGKIIDHMNRLQKGFDKTITQSHKKCFAI